MMGFRFQTPLWLLLLIPLVAVGIWAIRRQRRSAVLYSDTSLLAKLPWTLSLRFKRLLPWIRLLGMVLVIFALARPQQGEDEFRIRAEGIAIQMCIDRSGSMEAIDFRLDGRRVNRLDAVKHVFHDFVAGDGDQLEGRPDDLIGLIDFGGFANSRCPLTLDHGVLLQVLQTVEIFQPIRNPATGTVLFADLAREEQMTAIGDAVALAVERLKEIEAKSRVIVLLSDGENTAGAVDPLEAAQAAKAFGIKIYTIGVGSTGRAQFPGTDFFGRPTVQWQDVRLDEKTLREMAETTGGQYFNASSTDALVDVYAQIDKLEKTETDEVLYTEYREWYQTFLLAGLLLILAEIVLGSTRFRSLP